MQISSKKWPEIAQGSAETWKTNGFGKHLLGSLTEELCKKSIIKGLVPESGKENCGGVMMVTSSLVYGLRYLVGLLTGGWKMVNEVFR